MAVWEMATVNGVPRMHRDTNLADLAGATYIVFMRVVTYADFMAFWSLLHSGGNASEIWADATGQIFRNLNFGTDAAIITGTSTVWYKIAFTLSTSGATKTLQPYHQAFVGGTFTTDSAATSTSTINAITRMRFGANDSFLNDMQGTFRCAGIRIYQAVLTTTEIQTEFASRTPVRTTNNVFANPGDGVTALNVDQSATADNFVLTGTPTAISGDDPWATPGGPPIWLPRHLANSPHALM